MTGKMLGVTRLIGWHDRIAYHLDFWLYAGIAATVAWFYCDGWLWVAQVPLGFALFNFIEYWVHRVLLHGSLYERLHAEHHDHPEDYIVMPMWQVPALFTLFFFAMPSSWFAGFCIGYVFYFTVHHAMHHWDLERHPWIERHLSFLDASHWKHHGAQPCNYGVSTMFWDRLFGTYRSSAR